MIRYILLAGLLLLGLLVKSQIPVADFTADVTTGCAPLIVNLTDASSRDPKFWNWDLGNGQLSNKQNVQVVYYVPGVYTISLVARNANGTNGITKTNYITVNPSPQVQFSVDYNTACLPANIQFKDESVANAGSLSSWAWNFGDGTTSTQQNPVKAYNAIGFNTISLTVTNSTGCSNTMSKNRFVRIVSGVNAAFKDPVAQVCKPPYNLNFMNETSGPGNLSYNWDFGNGNTSTSKDPVINVATSTPLNVQLIAQSDLGCKDTIKRTISVGSILTTFSSPDSACLNTPVSFQNTSTLVALTSNWTFSDGNFPSTQANATRSFTAAGSYAVKLVNKYADCTDSLTKTINILPLPTVDFTSNTPGACKAPLGVTFQDISPNAVSWSWNFGDGGTSSQKAPSHNYTTAGEYDVSLTITTSTGCQNTLTKPKFIRITPPVVLVANAPASGCVPFQFNAVPNVTAVDGISSYLWDFGDGGATSTAQNPSHTYNSVGNFTLKLSVVTNGGCTGSVTLANGITTGLPSTPAFSSDTAQTCSDSSIQFKNLSIPSTGLTYLWDFGDGKTSTLMDPSHKYTIPGSYTVSLTTSNNRCLNTETKPAYITVAPPLAKFTFKSDCSTSPTVTFTNASTSDNTKPLVYSWNFGDPANGSSSATDPVYTFPSKTTYNVRLTVTNGGCVNTLVVPVALAVQIADFSKNTPDTICRSQNITLTSINSNPQNISRYQWSFDGGPFVDGGNMISSGFNRNGNIPLSLAITDLGGCSDTITKQVTIIGSKADFAAADSVACVNGTVSFNDLSTPAGSITQWTFDYGDGVKQTYKNTPFTHQYKTAGVYNITLTTTGKDGCTDVITHNNVIRISKPTTAFNTKDTLICPGGGVQFTDSSNIINPFSFLWNFGDGLTSNQQNPSHIYTGKDSLYSVSLKIQDVYGCTDSLTKPKYIKVTSPRSAFSISDSTTICPPLEAEFVIKGQDHTSFHWDFGDNTTSTLDTAIHFYNTYGVFVAKLFVVGAGGCIDSSEHTVSITNPYSSVISYSPVTGCNSLLVDFVVKTPINTYFNFIFGDGASDKSQNDSLQHFYSSPNSYGPYIQIGDSSGCQIDVSGATSIKVLGADPFFSADRKSFCDSGTVYFTNYTLGNDPVISSTWDFGDGNTSTDKDAVHSYNKPGQYIASLSVVTQSGCSKTLTDTIRVYRTPVPSILGDSIVCINSPLSLKAVLSAADSTAVYTWNLGNGSNSSKMNVDVTYIKEGPYPVSLEVVNILGCKGSDSKNIVVAPLPVITAAADIIVPVGTGITIPITYSQNTKSYNWVPASGLSCGTCATPFANPKTTTTYTVNVTDSNGCTNSSTFTITVVCNEKNYFVPNTFSPNGDGNNDIFFPRGNSINNVQSMRIFNRWGELIFAKRNFSANNPSEGWNGTHKGKNAPSDVYVYIVEFICENGSIIPFKGNVTLIR
ncbi:MAG: PKD domain-containing protein [Chitinophagaceae bacterium]